MNEEGRLIGTGVRQSEVDFLDSLYELPFRSVPWKSSRA